MVTVYSVGNRDWDTHSDNFKPLKNTLLPVMDQGVSALLEDLEGRGLLDETLVVWMGDMGRTPRINKARRPRPLVVLLFRRAGRRRRPRRPGVRLLGSQRGLPVHQPGQPRRRRRHHLPLPGHRPHART